MDAASTTMEGTPSVIAAALKLRQTQAASSSAALGALSVMVYQTVRYALQCSTSCSDQHCLSAASVQHGKHAHQLNMR
jgi:hypothetical protein